MATPREGDDQEVPAPLAARNGPTQNAAGLRSVPPPATPCWGPVDRNNQLVHELVCTGQTPCTGRHDACIVPAPVLLGFQNTPLPFAGCSAQAGHAWPGDGTTTTLPAPRWPTGTCLQVWVLGCGAQPPSSPSPRLPGGLGAPASCLEGTRVIPGDNNFLVETTAS